MPQWGAFEIVRQLVTCFTASKEARQQVRLAHSLGCGPSPSIGFEHCSSRIETNFLSNFQVYLQTVSRQNKCIADFRSYRDAKFERQSFG